ncbi:MULTISPECIES: STAS domain-containing protein [unclassified Schlesneria]|uniref:STAS domain-containing protein n=1 Tax=Schlesneria TaxID=656899 RepID=UPI002EEA7FD0
MQTNGPLTEYRDGKVTIIVFGEDLKHLDEVNVVEIGKKLLQIVESVTHPLLVLDLHATEFFGSSFIESLFRVWKQLNRKPAAKFGLAGLQPYCREVLEVTHLDRLWPLFDDAETAAAAFNQA